MAATSPLLLGIDVGSTAIKTVAQRGDDIVWSDYRRHESRPAERLLDVLRDVEAATGAAPGACQAYISGSAGAALAEVVGARHVQEVAALSLAVQRRHPDARAVIELGGHDAKVLVFEEDAGRTRTSVSMNDKCAGGTGAVIDKLAAKLKIPPAAVGDLGYRGLQIYPVAGKCGVFAETDINGLQKRGVHAGDLMASLFDAIVTQNLAVLSRGYTLRPRVLLVGGPNAFIRGLREAWQAHIGEVWRERGIVLPDGLDPADAAEAPPFAAHLVALGAIEFGRREGEAIPYRGAEALAGTVGALRQATGRRGAAAVAVSGLGPGRVPCAIRLAALAPPTLEPGTTRRRIHRPRRRIDVHQGRAAGCRGRGARQGLPAVARQPHRGRRRHVPGAAAPGRVAGRLDRRARPGHHRLREGHAARRCSPPTPRWSKPWPTPSRRSSSTTTLT